jgi:Cu(I)/Ag(I) efflux system periplasmic protein CusF
MKNLLPTLKEIIMNNIKTLLILAAISAGAAHAQMTMKPGDPPMVMDGKQEMAAPKGDMTEAEVRKVDQENKKITLKHGDIKNLDMPGMTMVFQVKDPSMLDKVKTGDKVLFKAEKASGAIVVTDLQPAK